MGLWQRSELSALLTYNFPALAERNSKDMKWKKLERETQRNRDVIWLIDRFAAQLQDHR